MEIEPTQIVFADYDVEDRTRRRVERLYVRNLDTYFNEAHFTLKLFDKAKIRVSPQQFSLKPDQIQEIIIELLPFSPHSTQLELSDFMLISQNDGQLEQRIPIIIQLLPSNRTSSSAILLQQQQQQQQLLQQQQQSFMIGSSSRSSIQHSTSRPHLLNPEVQKTMTLKLGELQERAFEQLLDEKDRLIARLEEKIARRENYYAQVESMVRGNSSFREVQIVWSEFRQRQEKEAEERNAHYEREIRRYEQLCAQREEEVAIVLQRQELAVQAAEIEARKSQELAAQLEQQNRDFKKQITTLQRELRAAEKDSLETDFQLTDERITHYKDEIESIRTLLYAEKQKTSAAVLQAEILANENAYLQTQIVSAEDRLESAQHDKKLFKERLSEDKNILATQERARILELEAKLDKLTASKKKVENEEQNLIEKYRLQYEDLRKKYTHQQKILEEMEKKNLADIIAQDQQSTQNQVSSQQQQLQEQLKKLQLNEEEINRINSLLLAGDGQRMNIASQLQAKTDEIEEMKVSHAAIVAQLHEQLDDLSHSLHQAHQANKDNVTSRIALIEKIKDKFEDSSKDKDARFVQELQRFQTSNENLQTELDRKQREITSLSNKLSEITSQHAAFVKANTKESEKKPKKSSANSPKSPLEELQARVKALANQLEVRDQQVEDLRAELKQAKSARDELEKTAKKKESTLQKKMDELETQKKEIQESAGNTSAISVSDQTVKALRQEVKDLERQYFQEVENNKIAMAALHSKEHEINSKTATSQKQLQSQLNSAKEQCENATHRVAELEEEILQLSIDYRDFESRSTQEKMQMQSVINELQAHCETCEKELGELRTNFEKLQRRCERDKSYRSTFGEELVGVRQFVTQIEDEKEKIAVQMRLKDHALEHHVNQREQLEALLREVQAEYSTLESQSQEQITELQVQLDFYKNEADQLNFQHNRATDKHATLSTDLQAQLSQNTDLKKKLAQAQLKIEALQSTLDQYDKTKNKLVNTLRAQLAEHKAQNAMLFQEKNQVQAELEDLHKDFVQSRNISSLHLSSLRSKFEKEFKEFVALTMTKIAFFVSKKDSLDIPTKINVLFEKFLENASLVSEKEASLKVLTSKLAKTKAKLAVTIAEATQQPPPKKAIPHNKYSIPAIVEHSKTILAAADFEKLSFDMQQFQSIAEARLAEIETLKSQLLSKDEKIKSISAALKQAKIDWQTEKDKGEKSEELRVALAKRVESLEAQLKANNVKLNQKTEELKEIARITAANTAFREDIKKKEELIEQLSINIANQKETISKLNRSIAENQRKEDYVNQMQEKFNASKEAEAQLLQEKAANQQTIASLKNDIIRKELLLKNKQALEEQVLELKSENNKLKEKNSKNKDNIKKLNATIRIKDNNREDRNRQQSMVFEDQNPSQIRSNNRSRAEIDDNSYPGGGAYAGGQDDGEEQYDEEQVVDALMKQSSKQRSSMKMDRTQSGHQRYQ